MSLEKEWQAGVERVTDALARLPEPEAARLRTLCGAMMEQKRALQEISSRADAASRCGECGGACCVRGRYHFTGADLLVYLVAREPLFAPLFENGLCPYLDRDRCLMAAEYRPFNCITFNCELIEDRLPPEEVARFYRLERELSRIYHEIRALFPSGAVNGALLK